MEVVQAPKEEVAPMSMAMGPPPSRKMTRTPPVYQQVFFFQTFLSCLKPVCDSWIAVYQQAFLFAKTFLSCLKPVLPCLKLICGSWIISGGEEKLPRRSPPWQARQCPGTSNSFLTIYHQNYF